MTKLKIIVIELALLLCASVAFGQSDIDGNKLQNQIRVGFDGSTYSDGRSASVGVIDVTARVTPKFSLETVENGGVYFGSGFAGGGLYANFTDGKSYVRLGGFRNSNTHTTQLWGAGVEAGTVLWSQDDSFLKAVEGDAIWDTRGFNLSPTYAASTYAGRLVFYFANDADIMFQCGAIETRSAGVFNATPTGNVRLRIPVARRLSFTASAGFAAETLTNSIQLANLSSKNIGAGVDVWVTRSAYVRAQAVQSYYNENHLSGRTYSVSFTKVF